MEPDIARMIILDTNVVSELMRPESAPQVAAGVRNRDRHELRATSITLAEIRYAGHRLPGPIRRRPSCSAKSAKSLVFSVSPGHALAVPGRVIATWWEATDEERAGILALVDEVKSQLDAELRSGPIGGQLSTRRSTRSIVIRSPSITYTTRYGPTCSRW